MRDTGARLGFQDAQVDQDWTLYWADSGHDALKVTLNPFQRVNHFPGMHEICRKDLLARNLVRMQKKFSADFDFAPKTWVLPQDYGLFTAHVRDSSANETFIFKPENGSQGHGIYLLKGEGGRVETACPWCCRVLRPRSLSPRRVHTRLACRSWLATGRAIAARRAPALDRAAAWPCQARRRRVSRRP